MKEQIKEVLECMTVENLKELKLFFESVQKDVEKDLKKNLLDSELRDKKAIVNSSFPLLLTLGGLDVLEIIREIEDERRELLGI